MHEAAAEYDRLVSEAPRKLESPAAVEIEADRLPEAVSAPWQTLASRRESERR